MSSVVDKSVAAKVAAKLSSGNALEHSYLLEGLEESFEELVAEAEPLIAEESGFQPSQPAVARVLTRADWAQANVDSMLELMAPLLSKVESKLESPKGVPAFKSAYAAGLGAQLGAVLGFLATRVLGQYDVLMAHQNQVWFVGANIVMTERRLGFTPRDFRLWVVLHELTHRGQFEANAWVRPYFRSMVDELLEVMQMDPKTLLDRLGAALQPGEKKDADAGPLALRFLEPRQREVFDQVQAFMSVIEGHGNFVMDRIGEVHIPSQPRMSRALRSPENSLQTPMGKLIGKLLGLEFKKAQYVQGQHFFDTIYEQGGSAAVKACFSAPEALPSLAEVRAPESWMQRMAP